MNFLREFNTENDYLILKDNLEFPTISLVNEIDSIYYVRNPLWGLKSEETIGGDICLYDSILKRNIIIKNNDLLNYSDINRYTPIGVVVIPRNT